MVLGLDRDGKLSVSVGGEPIWKLFWEKEKDGDKR